MHSSAKMRDRRNASLSVSSTSSTDSSLSAYSTPNSLNLNEKRPLSPPPPTPTFLSPASTSPRIKAGSRIRSWVTKALAAVCLVSLVWRLWTGRSFVVHNSKLIDHTADLPATLADGPTALVVTDRSGRSKWTVAIPHDAPFPLRAAQYRGICKQSLHLKESIAQKSRLDRFGHWRSRQPYYSKDRTYLDVADAEQSGNLPAPTGAVAQDVCGTSMTFVMDADDASLGKTLLMLWLSYGLAKKEGRAFFIDDTRWSYGNYSSYFPPVPSQDCTPPPSHHIVPCPHQAKHLVVSSSTAPWTFGSSFHDEYSDTRTQSIDRNRRVFNLIRTGYEDLFHLIGEDALYADSRIARTRDAAAAHDRSVIGMHIRRGDLHPIEQQFSNDYLPLDRYTSSAHKLSQSLLQAKAPHTADKDADSSSSSLSTDFPHSPLIMSSDDPDIFTSPDLAPFPIHKAQERIQLATKATLDQASPVPDVSDPASPYIKHVDENSGWEGGFYSALFLSIGRARVTDNNNLGGRGGEEDDHPAVSTDGMRMRELVGRAYLLDLAVLGASDGVVCAVSGAACRVLGIMLGWDAVREGRWVNVDDGRGWSWDGQD